MSDRIGKVALPLQVTMKVLEAHPDASPYEVTNIAFHWTFDRMKVLEDALQSVTPAPHFGESEQTKAWWAKARAALEVRDV